MLNLCRESRAMTMAILRSSQEPQPHVPATPDPWPELPPTDPVPPEPVPPPEPSPSPTPPEPLPTPIPPLVPPLIISRALA
jgi:hypothetical protein